MDTEKNIDAALKAWQLILDTILELAQKGISSGELYAHLMIVPGYSVDRHEQALRILTDANRITVSRRGWVEVL